MAEGADHRASGHGDHPNLHTVYVLVEKDNDPILEAVQIKTGISDGIITEVVSGLEEGAKIVTGAVVAGAGSGAPSGPMGGFPRMR
jgi:hypothetical protein